MIDNDTRVQQTLAEIAELRKVLAQASAIADDARTIVADMIDNSGGLKPHSAYYLTHIRNTFNGCIEDVRRTLVYLETDVEWLPKMLEEKAS